MTPCGAPGAFDSKVEAQTAAAVQRLRAVEEARHHHDVMNALTGIEGAATILVADNVPDEDRASLAGMLASGVAHLRSLIESKNRGGGPISLAKVAGDVAGEPPWRSQVDLDVAADLVAVGATAPIAEALRLLLGSGRELAPVGPLVLRGGREGGRVGLWLDARDEIRVPADLPVAIHVAARLVRGEGGDVRVAVGNAGRASIGIWLPGAADAGGGEGEACD